MNPVPSLQTWDILKELGFARDDSVISDISPGLSFDFGNFRLTASCVTNLQFVKVVLFGGVLASRRTIAEVHFEMPREVASREQCAAWIVWGLEQGLGQTFQPARHVDWLETGRSSRLQLPWLMELAARAARPQCSVERTWAQTILKELRAALLAASDELEVTFAFDGDVLKICCGSKVIAAAATGKPWPQRYGLRAGRLRNLPRRLRDPQVGFSVWEDDLEIANVRYEGATAYPLTSPGPRE